MSLRQDFSQKLTSFTSWIRTLSLQESLKQVWVRFPLSILSLVILTFSWLLITDFAYGVCCLDGFRLYLFTNLYFFFRLAIVAAIGVVLFTIIRLYWESQQVDQNRLLVYYAIGLIILSLVFVIFPWQTQDLALQYVYQTFLLGLALVFLFLIVPFVYSYTNQGVWSFWYSMGYNFVIAYAFGLIINLGLSSALGFASFLFNLDIPPKIYVMLLVLSVITFGTWYFLASLPDIKSILAHKEVVYPKYLKFLAKYILPFIFAVYLLILYIYSFRIVITQNWPFNQVALPVVWFVIIGFGAVILLFPWLQELWAKRLSQIIYISLLPIMAVYFLAVGLRINDFGWTIDRYLLVVFGIWVVLISLYFLISSKPLLKTWSVSIVLILLVVSFGPWGIFAVSKTDQLQRLKEVLQAQGLLVDGKIRPTNKVLACTEKAKIRNIMEYLVSNHGVNSLQDLYTPQDWAKIMQKINQNNRPQDSGRVYYYNAYPDFNQVIIALVEQMGLDTNLIRNCDWLSTTNQTATFYYRATETSSLKFVKDAEVVYFQINYWDFVNSSTSNEMAYTIAISDELELVVELVAIKEADAQSYETVQKIDEPNQLDKYLPSTVAPINGFVSLNLQTKNYPQTTIDLVGPLKQSILSYLTESVKSVNFRDFDLQNHFGKKPFILLSQRPMNNLEVTVMLTELQVGGQYTEFDGQVSLDLIRVREIQGLILVSKLN